MNKIAGCLFSIFAFFTFGFEPSYGSNFFTQKMIEEINQRPLPGYPENFNELPQFEVTGRLLYPLSGADISYPIKLFPKISTFVLVDESPLHDDRLMGAGSLPFQTMTIPDSMGMFPGYDLTGVAFKIPGELTTFSDDNRLGTYLLLRLHDLCQAEILTVNEITPQVTEIRAKKLDKSIITIFHVKAFLGNGKEPGVEWLRKQAFSYQAFLVKGASIFLGGPSTLTRGVFYDVQELLSYSTYFRVVTDSSPAYMFNGNMAHFFDFNQLSQHENHIQKIESKFGYGSNIVIGNQTLLYKEYPSEISVRYRERQLSLQKANEEAQHRRKIAEEKLNKALNGTLTEKIEYLSSIGMLQIENARLISIKWKANRESTMLPSVISEIIDQSKSIESVQIHVDVREEVNECLKLLPVLSQLKNRSQVKSLKLTVERESAFLSEYAQKVLDVIRTLYSLEHLELQLNDKAAKYSVEVVRDLKNDGNLQSVKITPIGIWNHPDTQGIIDSLLKNAGGA